MRLLRPYPWIVLLASCGRGPVVCGDQVAPVATGDPGSAGNVLVVLLDDVGTDQLAAWGVGRDVASTPTIDCLCARGLRFTQAWASPMCSPTRSDLVTGRYNRRTGVGEILSNEQPTYALPLAEDTLAEVAERAGYTTGWIGKWHLASLDSPGAPSHPNRSGFDRFAGSLSNLSNGFTPDHGELGWDRWEKVTDGEVEITEAYPTTDAVDEALAFVAGAPEPWLLVLALQAPHVPLHEPPKRLVNERLDRHPSDREEYRAALEAADTELGRLFRELDPQVLADATIVFASDNGSPDEAIVAPLSRSRGKGTMFEGGVRVPLVVAGPAVAAPGTTDALAHLVDVLPTVAELAGATPEAALDGRSLLPILADPEAAVHDTVASFLYTPVGTHPPAELSEAIRDADHKLVHHPDGTRSLYAVEPDELDEGEDLLLAPLSGEEAEEVEALEAALAALDRTF